MYGHSWLVSATSGTTRPTPRATAVEARPVRTQASSVRSAASEVRRDASCASIRSMLSGGRFLDRRLLGGGEHQRLATLPAVDGAAAVLRAARAAAARDRGLLDGEQPLDLAELGVGLLQLGRLADEHLEPEVVADGHLVGQAAEVPRQPGDALGQGVTLDAQLAARLLLELDLAVGRGDAALLEAGDDGAHPMSSEVVPPPAGL